MCIPCAHRGAPDESLAGSWRRTNGPLTVLTPLAQTSLQRATHQASAGARYSRRGVDAMAAKSDITATNITRSHVTAYSLTNMFPATRLHKITPAARLPSDSQP